MHYGGCPPSGSTAFTQAKISGTMQDAFGFLAKFFYEVLSDMRSSSMQRSSMAVA